MAAVEKQFGERALGDLPRDGWRKAFYKAPLLAWRTGMRRLLPPVMACITTRGRKSGLPRHTMVEHYPFGGKYYVVSGWQEKPQWVQNLLADPTVTLQSSWGKPFYGTASRLQDDDTMRRVFKGMHNSPMWVPWLTANGIEDDADDFIAKKDRVYIFQITPTGDADLPPLQADLIWVTGLAVFGLIFLLLLGLLRKQKG